MRLSEQSSPAVVAADVFRATTDQLHSLEQRADSLRKMRKILRDQLEPNEKARYSILDVVLSDPSFLAGRASLATGIMGQRALKFLTNAALTFLDQVEMAFAIENEEMHDSLTDVMWKARAAVMPLKKAESSADESKK